ncbi:Polycystic kidney disease and receptor for egg jelly-related protein [Mizuhopecten yessoensis]|uniref:Polycystic kidney disease and receptor for egg jelly-related protein n=1 Tax=Mizuhopecten yessoensis TaxID=6573 RepID=A0A210QFT4_MIZYE|nr:Polycystic kidney disease and receptor for egg jelly-related protein [Mizuhopecten yessoensis]
MANNGSSLHFRITSRENWEMTKFRICLVYNASTVDPPCIHEAKGHVDFSESLTEVVYDYQLWTSGCLFWDETTESFISNGTRVSNITTPEVTVCMTNHLTSFGGDFAVPPNTIDFTNVWAKFKNLNENAAVFSTVISLMGLYIILLIWARYKDKKDVQKWGASPLDDNLPTDNYHYQVTVQTGVRKLAATNSEVSFILSGEESDTGVRRLYDGQRKTFVRGSIMNYILSVESCLGPLNFMRIWHDNKGKGKMRSWYLDQVQITDLQTGDRYFFLCDRWLAVEEDDGMVDRILPVAGLEDLAAFKQLFSSSVKKKLTNDHLWFSVFSRPTRSNFTRVQRISCCVSLLFMTMITNAMWFKSEDKSSNTSAMKIGPISFTLQQLFVSFASTMIVFPVNFVLMTFFRKCRPRKNGVMHKNQQVPKRGKWKSVSASQSQTWGRVPMKSRWQRFKESITNFINFQRHKSKYQSEPDPDECVREMKIAGIPDSAQKKKKRKKKPGTLPHWCIYIAWVLCFFSITSSGFFTILYSMEWGPEKANEWLTTFLMSFFQSVLVVQPIKVFVLVAFIACILKKPDLDDEDPGEDLNNVIAAHDEEFTAKSNTAIDEIALRRKVQNSELKPPDMKTLGEQRQLRMMELKMEEVIREIGIYALFVLILFFLSYQTRDSDSFLMADNLKNTLGSGFEKISTVTDYWNWLENKLIPNLYATHYANGTEVKPWWDKRCIKDMESRRVGLPRLRQLRVKENTCVVNPALSTMIKHCRDEYGWTDDDAKHYLPGWKKPPEENITALKEEKSPWVYQNSVKLKSAPYMGTISTYKGGGYVALFERNVTWTNRIIEKLKKDVWLDVYTRGVFLEFAVYNPNINLFSSAILLTEFVSSGGAVARIEFKVFRLLNYVGAFGILVVIFQVIYACFSLYFFIRCIKKVRKEKMKYFGRFWNLLEFILLCFCIAVIAMYAFKQILSELTMRALKDPDKADYVNFQSMAMYDELFGWMMACVVFLATVQFLKLLQFNKKMNMLGDTIKVATKDLKVFSIAFALYFFAFTACGHLLFGTSILAYASLLGSAESMFAFTLGTFDFAAMADVNKVLGPLFFFTFVGVVYVGLMSMFFTIIGDAFTEVKANVEQGTNDYEIVGFMWKKIKGVLGLT